MVFPMSRGIFPGCKRLEADVTLVRFAMAGIVNVELAGTDKPFVTLLAFVHLLLMNIFLVVSQTVIGRKSFVALGAQDVSLTSRPQFLLLMLPQISN